MSYKEDHEAFVSNLQGSSTLDVILCIAHVPLLSLLLKHIQSEHASSPFRDILLYIIPMLCTITITSNFDYQSMLFLTVYLTMAYRRSIPNVLKHINFDGRLKNVTHLRSTYYLTLFKGANVLMTCLAILAVDFTIFPRTFGKTETFGVSLMDAGVGSFIVSSAFTSKYARGLKPLNNTKQESSGSKTTRTVSSLIRKIPFQKLFVLLLGVGRMIALKVINYQEHVSEYGVHWNFFVTLFCVWSVADIIHWLTDDRFRVAMLASCHWIVYQMALTHTPLTHYMMSSVRNNLISANKEGIISLNGYIPLYLIAECLAYYMFFNEGRPLPVPKTSTPHHECKDGVCTLIEPTVVVECCEGHTSSESWRTPFTRMLLVSGVSWVVWMLSAALVQPTSRRLVNIAYCALTLALAVSVTAALYVIEVISALGPTTNKSNNNSEESSDIPLLTIEYMSKHSLMVFLVGNLLTGLVNKTFQTIRMSSLSSFGVLVVYGVCLSVIAWSCERFSKSSRANK